MKKNAKKTNGKTKEVSDFKTKEEAQANVEKEMEENYPITNLIYNFLTFNFGGPNTNDNRHNKQTGKPNVPPYGGG